MIRATLMKAIKQKKLIQPKTYTADKYSILLLQDICHFKNNVYRDCNKSIKIAIPSSGNQLNLVWREKATITSIAVFKTKMFFQDVFGRIFNDTSYGVEIIGVNINGIIYTDGNVWLAYSEANQQNLIDQTNQAYRAHDEN